MKVVALILAALTSFDGGVPLPPQAPTYSITDPDGGVTYVPLTGGQQYVDVEDALSDAGITPVRAAISYQGRVLDGPLWAFTPQKVKELNERLDVAPAQQLAMTTDGGSQSDVLHLVTVVVSGLTAGFTGYAANRTARHLPLWPP